MREKMELFAVPDQKPRRRRGVMRHTIATLAELQRIAVSRGGACTSPEYVNAHTHLDFECAEGHRWRASPTTIRGGRWCARCACRISMALGYASQSQKAGDFWHELCDLVALARKAGCSTWSEVAQWLNVRGHRTIRDRKPFNHHSIAAALRRGHLIPRAVHPTEPPPVRPTALACGPGYDKRGPVAFALTGRNHDKRGAVVRSGPWHNPPWITAGSTTANAG